MNNRELCHTTEPAALEARVVELESRLLFQEDALQALGAELARQQAVTDQQQRMLQTVYRQLCELRDGQDTDAPPDAEERPPHY